jgi:zinc-ribbon domain
MTTVRCPHCGHENPPGHVFCGMCGKGLDEPVMEAPVPHAPARGQRPAEPEPQHHEPPTPAPAYTCGLFNLGAPADRPSRNLDYLLEDDEPRSRKGLVIGILALLLVAGLGYLRWRNGKLPFSDLIKPAPKTTAQNTESGAPPAASDQTTPPPATTTVTVPAPDAAPAATTPANATPTPAVPEPGNAPPASSPPAEQAPTASTPSETGASPTAQPAAPTAQAAEEAASPATEKPSTTPAPAAEAPAESAPPTPTPKAPKPKPSPKALPPTPAADSVAMGERYLYGRGVPQDCARGLRYVKPAADQANPKAMITMGALYATGHCLSKDLPTAYRFFALALRKDPENGPLKQNAQMVWTQMTEAEKQQAIRMTQ